MGCFVLVVVWMLCDWVCICYEVVYRYYMVGVLCVRVFVLDCGVICGLF